MSQEPSCPDLPIIWITSKNLPPTIELGISSSHVCLAQAELPPRPELWPFVKNKNLKNAPFYVNWSKNSNDTLISLIKVGNSLLRMHVGGYDAGNNSNKLERDRRGFTVPGATAWIWTSRPQPMWPQLMLLGGDVTFRGGSNWWSSSHWGSTWQK